MGGRRAEEEEESERELLLLLEWRWRMEVRQLRGSFQSAQEDLEFELLERPGAQRSCWRTWVGVWSGFS